MCMGTSYDGYDQQDSHRGGLRQLAFMRCRFAAASWPPPSPLLVATLTRHCAKQHCSSFHCQAAVEGGGLGAGWRGRDGQPCRSQQAKCGDRWKGAAGEQNWEQIQQVNWFSLQQIQCTRVAAETLVPLQEGRPPCRKQCVNECSRNARDVDGMRSTSSKWWYVRMRHVGERLERSQ